MKHNKEQMMRQYSSSPNNAKPNVMCTLRVWFVNQLNKKVHPLSNSTLPLLHKSDLGAIQNYAGKMAEPNNVPPEASNGWKASLKESENIIY